MDLKDVAAISGKPGLFRIVKPTRNGMIIETLDEQRKKTMVSATHRVSILKEISIYITGEDDSAPLGEVLLAIKEQFGDNCNPDTSGAALADFMEKVLPNYDAARVYDSDIKKLVKWYNIILQFAPDVFDTLAKQAAGEEEVEVKEEETAEESK